MTTPMTPWIDLTLHQALRWQHLVWFLYGWAEREHRLGSVDAVDAHRRKRACEADAHVGGAAAEVEHATVAGIADAGAEVLDELIVRHREVGRSVGARLLGIRHDLGLGAASHLHILRAHRNHVQHRGGAA